MYERDKPSLFCKIPFLLPFNIASNQINAHSGKNKILLFYVKGYMRQWKKHRVPPSPVGIIMKNLFVIFQEPSYSEHRNHI